MSSRPSYRLRRRFLDWCRSSELTSSAGGRPNFLRPNAPLMKLMKLVVFVAVCGGVAALLSACSTSGAVSECAWVEPIYIGEMDTLSEETAQQILAHNEAWQVICE